MRILSVLFLGPLASAVHLYGRDSTISSSFTDSSVGGSIGNYGTLTTINSGVTYWVAGLGAHNLNGDINNYGSIYVSQTAWLKSAIAAGQTANWSPGVLNNYAGALIQLNDIGSGSAPTYDWYLTTLTNTGTLQFCGRGDTGGSTYQLYSTNDGINNGLISFEQSANNYGAAFVWRNPTLTPYGVSGNNIYNNGAFRLINVVYHNVQNIYGTGCWQIGKGAVLYLEDGSGAYQNPSYGPTFPGQSILFMDSTAVLHMDAQVYSHNSTFGPQVYGFASGNAIEFSEVISSFGYATATGLLTVTFISSKKVYIKLGTGYVATNFVKNNNPEKYNIIGYNAIFYNGNAPSQSAPVSCALTAPVCQDLGLYPPSSTSTTSISSSASSTKAISTFLSTSTNSFTSSLVSTSLASSPTLTSLSSLSISTTISTSSSTSTSLSSLSISTSISTSSSTSTSLTSSPTSTSLSSLSISATISTSSSTSTSLIYSSTSTSLISSQTSTSLTSSPTSTSLSSLSISTSIPTSSLATPTSSSPSFTSSTITSIVFTSSTTSSVLPSVTAAYLGCYTEATNTRALNDYPRLVSSSMSIEICQSYCSQYSAPLFGVEYGTECYCGNSLQAGSIPASALDCSFPCPGNSNETCGAGNRLNIYGNIPTTTTTSTSSAPFATYTGSCVAQGCFSEGANSRALNDFPRYVNSTSMTLEVCQGYCSQFNAQFFGVEYGSECYCGNVLQYGSISTPSSDCSFACPGNTAEICGAGNRLNVYACGTATASSYPTTTAGPALTCACSAQATATVTATVTMTKT